MVAITVWMAALAGFVVYLTTLGRFPLASYEERHRREMKDRTAMPSSVEPITAAEFLALPKNRSVAEYSGTERRAVSLEGRVLAMLRATDGDFHLEFAPDGDPAGHSVTLEISPAWHQDGANGWRFDRLLSIFRCDHFGVTGWDGDPARVRLSGWLLYDREDHWLPRLLGLPSPKFSTSWEIHPVTKIERWDDLRTAWVEVRR